MMSLSFRSWGRLHLYIAERKLNGNAFPNICLVRMAGQSTACASAHGIDRRRLDIRGMKPKVGTAVGTGPMVVRGREPPR
jgi:hypothetical protein